VHGIGDENGEKPYETGSLDAKEEDFAGQEKLEQPVLNGRVHLGQTIVPSFGPSAGRQSNCHYYDDQFEDFEDAGDLPEIVDVESGSAGDGGINRVGMVPTDDGIVEGFCRGCDHF